MLTPRKFAAIGSAAFAATMIGGVAIAAVSRMPLPAVFTDGFGDINVNASCGTQMNLDISYQSAPQNPWAFIVTTSAGDVYFFVDNDSDLMGYHPIIAADQLPDVSYTYKVTAVNSGTMFTNVFSGTVVCDDVPPEPSSTPEPTITITPSTLPIPVPTDTPSPEPSETGTTTPEPSVTPEPSTTPTPEVDVESEDIEANNALPVTGDPDYTG